MTTKRARFTFLDHTADMGIKVTGPTLEDLFENAGQSLMEIMIKKRPAGKTSLFSLSVSGEDLPDLMVRWLGEILYLFEGDSKIVMDIDIDVLAETRIDATLHTVPFNPKLHEVVTEIKAVTYHQIEVARRKDGWQATVIFDL
jgi:SHS2 domain-containing protein